MKNWETLFEAAFIANAGVLDPAHDLEHLKRVVRMAKSLCEKENADPNVVIPAAWLHDFINIPKNDPRRAQASRLCADAAITFLRSVSYPEKYFGGIAHAIAAHSFSAGITPTTIEARVVQDADRLDALGAIGIARVFVSAGLMKRAIYNPQDPCCSARAPIDQAFTVDHFYKKLLVVAKQMTTPSGQQIANQRLLVLQRYLNDLASEIA